MPRANRYPFQVSTAHFPLFQPPQYHSMFRSFSYPLPLINVNTNKATSLLKEDRLRARAHKYTRTAHVDNCVKINVSNEKIGLSQK